MKQELGLTPALYGAPENSATAADHTEVIPSDISTIEDIVRKVTGEHVLRDVQRQYAVSIAEQETGESAVQPGVELSWGTTLLSMAVDTGALIHPIENEHIGMLAVQSTPGEDDETRILVLVGRGSGDSVEALSWIYAGDVALSDDGAIFRPHELFKNTQVPTYMLESGTTGVIQFTLLPQAQLDISTRAIVEERHAA